MGAFITAILFAVGRFAIGLYLARSATASAYGAAGTLVALLLWLYYSAQVFLFGAEFTCIYANYRAGTRIGRLNPGGLDANE
jgi:membrane protein